jgi:2-keto-3-deoxy-L-rhamnonate aldolase RhmA
MSSKYRPDHVSIGSWLSLGSPYVAEIMAKSGFEWLAIDMEHSAANSIETAQRLIQVITLAGCGALVRVPSLDPSTIKLVMDAGANGVIVPMVNTPRQAEQAVRAVRYPPDGERGVGLWRAQGYGRSFTDYIEWSKTEALVIVQIEHIEGVKNLREILAVQGVDGFIVGPYDLSASLGKPGDFEDSGVQQALETIESGARGMEIWRGYHIVYPDRTQLEEKVSRGYNFIAYGVDFTYLTTSIDRESEYLRKR